MDGGGVDGVDRVDGVAPMTCPSPALQPGDTVQTVKVGATAAATSCTSRRLRRQEAGAAGRRLPRHRRVGIGRARARRTRRAGSEGVVMAFPDGLHGPAGTGWNVGPCCVADVDDVAFARALVAQVQTAACIDPGRVYAVGVLTGGGMAHDVACHAADVFAAVAPAAFDLLARKRERLQSAPARSRSSLSRGTADSRVPYAGGPSSLVPACPDHLSRREGDDRSLGANRSVCGRRVAA